MDFRDIFDETGKIPSQPYPDVAYDCVKGQGTQGVLVTLIPPLGFGKKEGRTPCYRKVSKIVWSCPGQYGSH